MHRASLESLAEKLANGETSSTEICQYFLNRIENLDKDINAFITVNHDQVLKEAKAADERRSRGATLSSFDGIPIAIKDNISTAGTLTTCASKILQDYIPPFNATSFELLKQKGLVLLGKANMDEFAMGSSTENSHYGATKNPWNHASVPGGSSGGSAASVSAGMAPVSIGSDTGGSIRQPAAFCGVVGVKPTYGRVSRYGLVAFASSLDQIGSFGSTVADAAQTLSFISAHDPKDSTSLEGSVDFDPAQLTTDIQGLKIGVPSEYFQSISPEIETAVQNQIKELEKRGAEIVDISLKYTDYAIPVYYLIATAEASSNLARFDGIRYGYRDEAAENLQELYTKTRSTGFGTEVKRRIVLGTFSLSSGYYDAYYLKALQCRSLIINDFKKAFETVDAIITPTTTKTAFKIGEMSNDPLEMYMSDILTISANLAGIPGVSVPVGCDSSNLPIGLQIMGPHFGEKRILSIATAVEEQVGFSPLNV